MGTNVKVQEFLNEVKEERKKKLLGIAMDTGYFKFLLKSMDEDIKRKELDIEKNKYKKDKKGKPTEFTGDLDKVKKLEKELDKVGDIKLKIENYETLYKDLAKYIDFVDSVDEETEKKLNDVYIKFGE